MTTKTNTTTTRPANMVMNPEESMAATLLALQKKCRDRRVTAKKGN
jgi:hypothetical protein